jgi:hypothetical protein
MLSISSVFFVEAVDEANRLKYEVMYLDPITQLKVWPVFVEFGE